MADDVPPGARWGGTPAKPVKDWFRELTLMTILDRSGRAASARLARAGEKLKPVVGPAHEGSNDGRYRSLDTAESCEILTYLPHRYPFLLVDRIIEMKGDESCIGIKNVTFNEPQFNGHFPGRPIMPGVLMIEGMAQTAGALCARTVGRAAQGSSIS